MDKVTPYSKAVAALAVAVLAAVLPDGWQPVALAAGPVLVFWVPNR